jgi:hypothetical protein
LRDHSKYPHLWHETQDELDSFDSLMRKKVYYQNSHGDKMDKDFVVNGYKPTFGIFSKDFKERVFQKSNLLQNQEQFVSISYNKQNIVRKITNRKKICRIEG